MEELAALVQALERSGLAQIDATLCRCLEALHGRWQAELEACGASACSS